APAGDSLGARLAAADPDKGKAVFNRVCGICHTANEGGPTRIGPNLWNIVGRQHSSVAGFSYSPVMKGKTGPWTYEDLNAWLANPARFAPGNRMGVGLADAKQRADVIAYLRSMSNDPKPFPAP
ncbi:MAG: cytochrome c family protein, partial [Acetobacteraceae bacterium]|nr:cytochrome c family protein [Acetobacteraceae bacterium]